MNLLRRLTIPLASCAFALGAATALRAQVTPATFIWTGATSSDVTDDSNWSATSIAADHTNPGKGDTSNPDSLIFGNSGNNSLLIPWPGIALANITFSADANDYTFSGEIDEELGNATISLTGNILNTVGGRSILMDSTLSLSLTDAAHTVCVASGSTLTINGTVSDSDGGGSIVKNGSGTLILGGANTFGGGVTVNAGTLLLGASSRYNPDSSQVTDGPVGTGALTLAGGATLGVDTNSISEVTLHNDIVLGGFGATATLDTTCADLTLTGYISGWSGLAKVGKGTLTLSNENSDFSGGVSVQAGTLLLGASSLGHQRPLDTTPETYQFVLDSGPVGTGTLTLAACTTLGVAGDGGFQLDNAIALDNTGGTVRFDTGNGNLTLTGNISGAAGITMTGSNTLTLTGANSFAGGLTVRDGGTLQLGGSTLDTNNKLTAFAASIATGPVGTGTLTLAGEATLSTAGVDDVFLANNISISGPISIALAHEHYDAKGWDGAGYYWDGLTLSGPLSGGGSIDLSGQGNLTLDGNNSAWSGGLNLDGRNLVTVFADNALGTGPLTFNGESESTVRFSTPNPSIGSLSGGFTTYQSDGSYYYGSTVSLDAGTTLVVNQATDGNYAGMITGAGALVKAGTASLTLSGIHNDYSGGTTINAGLLVAATNSALGTGSVTLNGGALSLASGVTLTNPLVFSSSTPVVLAGNGTFGTPILADSHVILSPGNSPGNLTFSAGLTLASGTAISFQVQDAAGAAGTGYDLITVSGSSSILALTAASNTITFNVVFLNADGVDGTPANFSPTSAYSWTFATSSNAITGFDPNQFHLVTAGASSGLPGIFTFTESADHQSLLLNFTPVPEPSTYALLALGLGLIIASTRRRRA